MDFDIIITQLDEHNEGNILITKKFNPKEIYYIIKDKDKVNINSVEEYYRVNLNNSSFRKVIIKEGNVNELEKLIDSFINKTVLVNLTGGSRVNSLILLDLCKKKNIDAIYINVKDKLIYKFKDKAYVVEEGFDDLEITDIVHAAGGEIIEESSNLCDKKDLLEFSKIIYTNLPLWHKYKQRLYESKIFQHDNINTRRIYINKDNLVDEESVIIYKILKKLEQMNEIKYSEVNNKITVEFQNSYLKAFIFKSGTWLEIATKKLVNKINEVDEVKNGVVFLWNSDNKTVRNELDVVAIKDSIPICISCKDSDKYNEMALNELNVYAPILFAYTLNELNVYANKIGGKDVYKILVATKEPIKSPVKVRAKEMGINIVIFDGDENKFINTIRAIVKS